MFVHANSPTFRAGKLKGFTVDYVVFDRCVVRCAPVNSSCTCVCVFG